MEHCVFLMRSQNLEVSRLALLPALPLVHRRKMMIRRLPSIYHGGEDVGFAPSVCLPETVATAGRRNSAELEFHAEKRKKERLVARDDIQRFL